MTDRAADDATQGRRPYGSLAAEVLRVLSAAASPLIPAEVRTLVDPTGSISYSAVVTTLTRLHDKGVVTRQRDGRAYRYAAVADPPALVAWRMSRLLESEPDHSRVLSRFVDSLDAEDEQTLRELLRGLD
ncbi:BlaI/MecI/CopY family transcriptional regulator [Crossiella sp. CA198]|uniref:BlaI/MecI/CopY family transcriptional regulator n=1 Tax=Crossiella sp. CA198 TaxID=3455607 RepID=UPI003F8D5413